MYPLNLGLAISNSRLWDEIQTELQSLPVRVVMEQEGIRDIVGFLEKVDKFRPDILVLDPSQLESDLQEIIAGVKATATKPFVIVAKESATPDDILRAIRAGANEYLYSPIGANLKDAIERIAKIREGTESARAGRGRTMGFLSAKGGCGATTIACHAALEFGRLSGKRVLLADFDFSSGAVRVLMQVKSRYSVLDAVNNTQRLDSSYWRSLVSNGFQGVEVIAGSSSDVMLEYPKALDVRSVLRFVKSQYDMILVDLGQGLDAGDLSILEELDDLILVSTPDIPALQLTKLVSQQLGRVGFRKDKIRVILNRMSRRVELEPREIEEAIGLDIYAVLPNDYSALEQAYSTGKLLPENNHLREGIRKIVRRLGELNEGETRRRFTLFGF